MNLQCVFRELINGQFQLCGKHAPYILDGNSLCVEHVFTVHETGRATDLINHLQQ
jgi:hypothetical protein